MSKANCLYCERPLATDSDQELSLGLSEIELPAAEEGLETKRLGLSDICWEPGEEHCMLAALDAGIPASLEDALNAWRRARGQRDALLKVLATDDLTAVEGVVERINHEMAGEPSEGSERIECSA